MRVLDRLESSVCLVVSVFKESKSTVPLFLEFIRIFLSCRFIYFPFCESLPVFVVGRFLSISPVFKKEEIDSSSEIFAKQFPDFLLNRQVFPFIFCYFVVYAIESQIFGNLFLLFNFFCNSSIFAVGLFLSFSAYLVHRKKIAEITRMYMILSNISIYSRVGKFVTRCDSNVVFLILHALSVFYELPFRVKNKCLFFFKGFRNIFTAISIIYNIPLRLFTTSHLPHLSNLLLRSSSNCFFQRVASNFQIDPKTCLKKKKIVFICNKKIHLLAIF